VGGIKGGFNKVLNNVNNRQPVTYRPAVFFMLKTIFLF
jgi:hypothetical protein